MKKNRNGYKSKLDIQQESNIFESRVYLSLSYSTVWTFWSLDPNILQVYLRVRFFKRIKNQIKNPDHMDFVYQKKQKSKNGFFQRWACETQRF